MVHQSLKEFKVVLQVFQQSLLQVVAVVTDLMLLEIVVVQVLVVEEQQVLQHLIHTLEEQEIHLLLVHLKEVMVDKDGTV
ncbi:MAG: hypothetical protein CME98_19680 [Hyphomonas sp.]|nr:hypothetical protein [Hyphomonas sp.]